MEIYTTLDCLSDIASVLRLDKPVIVYDLDDLVIKIYYHRKKTFSTGTIKNKLSKLAKQGYIKIVKKSYCEYGICYSDKAKVIIYRSKVMEAIGFTRTIELKPRTTLFEYLRG